MKQQQQWLDFTLVKPEAKHTEKLGFKGLLHMAVAWILHRVPGNVSASNVIEFLTSCSSPQPQHGCRACLSPTNSSAVVSGKGWSLSDQVMWLGTQTSWRFDGFRLISNIEAEQKKCIKHRTDTFCTFLGAGCLCRGAFPVSAVCGGSFSPACREKRIIGM